MAIDLDFFLAGEQNPNAPYGEQDEVDSLASEVALSAIIDFSDTFSDLEDLDLDLNFDGLFNEEEEGEDDDMETVISDYDSIIVVGDDNPMFFEEEGAFDL